MASLAAEFALPLLAGVLPGIVHNNPLNKLNPFMSGQGIKKRGRGDAAASPTTAIATPYGGRIDLNHLARHAVRAFHGAYKLFKNKKPSKKQNKTAHGVKKTTCKIAKGHGQRAHRKNTKTSKTGNAITPGPLP